MNHLRLLKNEYRGAEPLDEKARELCCSLVTPLKNERESIENLWKAIHSQTRRPDEWIITDNGSTDGTFEWIAREKENSSIPVRLLKLPGFTIAKMMNIAIQEATGGVVACCHGGTRIPSSWLAGLLSPLIENPEIDVVAGTWQVEGTTINKGWIARTMEGRGCLSDLESYLPASRSLAFKRSAWESVKGFPEWLPMFGEDTLFAIRLKASGCVFSLAREACVGWHPKSTLAGLFRQERLYSEANTMLGLRRFHPMLISRPWLFIGFALYAGWYMGRAWISGALLLTILVLDYLRTRWAVKATSVGGYFLWYWWVSLAEQAGWFSGRVKLLARKVVVPEGDRVAVEYYRNVVGKHRPVRTERQDSGHGRMKDYG